MSSEYYKCTTLVFGEKTPTHHETTKICVSKLELELNISMTNTEVHSMSRMNEIIEYSLDDLSLPYQPQV